MAKKDFTQGLQSLFGGADKSITQQQPKANAGMIEAALDRLPDTEEAAPRMDKEPTTFDDETDLINTIDDPDFKEELKERLRKKRLIGRGRPRKNDQLGRRMDGYDRTSLIINKEKWAKIKEIAIRETLTMKEIVELALDMVIERYENKHGKIIPEHDRKKDITEIF